MEQYNNSNILWCVVWVGTALLILMGAYIMRATTRMECESIAYKQGITLFPKQPKDVP